MDQGRGEEVKWGGVGGWAGGFAGGRAGWKQVSGSRCGWWSRVGRRARVSPAPRYLLLLLLLLQAGRM
ncbi:hypothetical protein E2C01_079075 [Portunus trituberculatus]|uniref:Uncharacterized protein n=1 Tax=Portunus trituberculatus TaxID=210409 RepID=A0A5B7IUL3_PORTR|nr:hypothetical protein [Portunus trituberculatus]